ncbi:MAG: hypothetical protein J5832_01705 [Clostridia bacterium]|nr:hypothetical protein [Clostridia bacterium]
MINYNCQTKPNIFCLRSIGIFIFFDKNADTLSFLLVLLGLVRFCLATIGVLRFLCVDFGWRTFLFSRKGKNMSKYKHKPCNAVMQIHYTNLPFKEYPQTHNCPKCQACVIIEKNGLVKYYDANGNLSSKFNQEIEEV